MSQPNPTKKVLYIHGIGAKPPAPNLKLEWDAFLFNFDPLWVPYKNSNMAYWADLRVEDQTIFNISMLQKALERLRDDILEEVTRLFIKDVHTYFYDQDHRDAIQARVLQTWLAMNPDVVVAHSLGTVIAYDLLESVLWKYPLSIDLITIGSPLGVDFVYAHEQEVYGKEKLEVPQGVKSWLNFADPGDPVALDTTLKDDYNGEGIIQDFQVTNPYNQHGLNWTASHAIQGYLTIPLVQEKIYGVLQ